MIIGNIRRATVHDRPALVADVAWEAGAARTQPLYFATDPATADALCLGAAPFLVACCLPAAHAGEARLSIAGETCPVLLDGVRTNLDYYERWYGGYGAMALECQPFTASAP